MWETFARIPPSDKAGGCLLNSTGLAIGGVGSKVPGCGNAVGPFCIHIAPAKVPLTFGG
jgi:hypothetical protein